jgi:DNA helicase HerA-like ATPase
VHLTSATPDASSFEAHHASPTKSASHVRTNKLARLFPARAASENLVRLHDLVNNFLTFSKKNFSIADQSRGALPLKNSVHHADVVDGIEFRVQSRVHDGIARTVNTTIMIAMAADTNDILLGKGEYDVYLRARFGNRHGLTAGATGTGKTVSLMVIAEGFSRIGVPVVMADVKGDVAGLSMPAVVTDTLRERAGRVGIADYRPEASPVIFWDIYGTAGHPLRATVSEVGPTLLGRMLDLNDTQTGVLEITSKLADDRGLLLMDLDDLRALLGYVAEMRNEVSTAYGLVSTASVAAIQRALLTLEREGGDQFFGEPALELTDLLRTELSGRGVISILGADQLVQKPRLYSSVLLWLLSELYENLPEIGDPEKPRVVFIFDEAHLLFADAPPELRRRVEQVVRLVRSKGVGVYFCSQFPDDVPNEILGQMGNRIQHALRAFTPRDQKAVRTAAETFTPNPSIDVASVIARLATGEALVSTLQENAIPMPVQRTLMAPPRCRIGAMTADERASVRARSPIGGKYDTRVNRESAYEILKKKVADQAAVPPAAHADAASPMHDWLWGTNRRQGMVESMAKQAARTVGSQLGRQILRGILGGIGKSGGS